MPGSTFNVEREVIDLTRSIVRSRRSQDGSRRRDAVLLGPVWTQRREREAEGSGQWKLRATEWRCTVGTRISVSFKTRLMISDNVRTVFDDLLQQSRQR